jgi:hypothetical protein
MITTYRLEFPAVNKRRRCKALSLLMILLIIISAIVFNNGAYWTFVGISMVPLVLWYQHLTYSREDPTPYLAEQLIFDIDKIIVGEEEFELQYLQNLTIIIKSFDGQTIQGRGKWILNGTNNHLSFTYLKTTFSLSFYIISETQRDQFKILFDTWYKNKVSFYEGDNAGKTYLLNQLKYLEIQEFKKRYDLS